MFFIRYRPIIRSGLNHLACLELIAQNGHIDTVYFAPTFNPVHKNASWLAPFDLRLEMAHKLVEGISPSLRSKIIVTDIEKEMGGVSFSIDVVECLEDLLSQSVGVYIGYDNARREVFKKWKEYERLLERGVGVIQGSGQVVTDLMDGMWIVGTLNTNIRSGMAREAYKNKDWSKLKSLVGVGVLGCLQNIKNLW